MPPLGVLDPETDTGAEEGPGGPGKPKETLAQRAARLAAADSTDSVAQAKPSESLSERAERLASEQYTRETIAPPGPYAAQTAQVFRQLGGRPTPTPIAAARDVSQTPATSDFNPSRAYTSKPAKFLSRVAQGAASPLENPAAFGANVVEAPIKAGLTAVRFGAEQDAANAVAQSGGDPSSVERTITPKEAAIAEAQVGTLAAAPVISKAATALVEGSGIAYVASNPRVAAAIGGAMAGVPAGAAYNPKDPGVGAVLGGAAGAVMSVAAGEKIYAKHTLARDIQLATERLFPKAPAAPEAGAPPPPTKWSEIESTIRNLRDTPEAPKDQAGLDKEQKVQQAMVVRIAAEKGYDAAQPQVPWANWVLENANKDPVQFLGDEQRFLAAQKGGTPAAAPPAEEAPAAPAPKLEKKATSGPARGSSQLIRPSAGPKPATPDESFAPPPRQIVAPSQTPAPEAANVPAGDLTLAEATKVAKVHELDDLVKQNLSMQAEASTKAGTDWSPEGAREMATRQVVDRYRDLVEKGASPEDAKATIGAEHLERAEAQGIKPETIETLAQRGERLAGEETKAEAAKPPVKETEAPEAPAPKSLREQFAQHYETELRAAMERKPDDFAYGPGEVKGVVSKMIDALGKGTANISPAIKRTAKKLGVEPTIKGLQSALNAEQPKPAVEGVAAPATPETKPEAKPATNPATPSAPTPAPETRKPETSEPAKGFQAPPAKNTVDEQGRQLAPVPKSKVPEVPHPAPRTLVNPESRYAGEENPESFREGAIDSAESAYRIWQHMEETLRTGQRHGKPLSDADKATLRKTTNGQRDIYEGNLSEIGDALGQDEADRIRQQIESGTLERPLPSESPSAAPAPILKTGEPEPEPANERSGKPGVRTLGPVRPAVPEGARESAPGGVRAPVRQLGPPGGSDRGAAAGAGTGGPAPHGNAEEGPGTEGTAHGEGAALPSAGATGEGTGTLGYDAGPRDLEPLGSSDLANQPGANYRLTPAAATALTEGGLVAKAKRNLQALDILKYIEHEQRAATRAEQEVLSGYAGWGALPHLFDPGHSKYAPLGPQLRALLTDTEWESARATTPNAHYTSPEVIEAVHALLNHLGFTGGRILEPSMGAGYFLGMTPADHRSAYHWTGVELDDLTGRIGKLLYPKSDIRVQGFQHLNLPDDYFDVAIGNVPFGNYKINDRRYNALDLSIHNYFFRKSLDLVRPGGLILYITSPFTMDARSTSVRDELAKYGHLVGALRLPSNAFKGIAGTDVTTDLIILQRRTAASERSADAQGWKNTVPTTVPGREGDVSLKVNEYFVAHPENILGELRGDGTMQAKFGGESEMTVRGTGNIGALFRAAIARFPSGIYEPEAIQSPASRTPQMAPEVLAPEGLKDRGLILEGDTIKQRRGHHLVDAGVPKSAVERVKKLIGLRDLTKRALAAQFNDEPDETIERERKALDKAYTAFVKEYGAISKEVRTESSRADGQGNPIVTVRRPNLQYFNDADAALVATLEHYDSETGAKKADILERRVFNPRKVVERAESPMDALPMVLAEEGKVNVDRIAELAGVGREDAITALRGQIFEDPESPGEWVTLDRYTSGDVKTKLEQAREAAKTNPLAWESNIKALEPAIPADIPPSEIDVGLGARWVPTSDYERFAVEVLGAGNGTAKIDYTKAGGVGYKVEVSYSLESSVPNTTDYGTKRITGAELLEKALNLQTPTIYGGTEEVDGVMHSYYNEDHEPIKNPIATVAAQEKQELLKDRFERWIWEDTKRADRLAAKYNLEHNRIRLSTPDGSHLTLPGTASYIKGQPFAMKKHQLDFIWRVIEYGNALAAHEVGLGKTYSMIAASMEEKRLGLAKKPMHVVLKHMIDQYAVEARQLYPGANMLIATDEDFAKENRKEFLARVAHNDWDLVIIGHSSFEKVPMSMEFQERYIRAQLAELDDAIREGKALKGKPATVKQIETAKKNLEARLEKMLAEHKKDDLLTFEQLGVDKLYVDEADAFKNLYFRTKLEGVSAPNAQKSFDMLMKSIYLEGVNPGRGLVFATGTPIANAVAEVYTMMRYLQPRVLAEAGIHDFDTWAAMFGRSFASVEMKPDTTGFRMKSRFSKFRNIGELAQLFRQAWDIKSADDLKAPDGSAAISRPPLKGGQMQMIETPASPGLKAYIQALGERSDRIMSGKVAPEEDNMLKITSDGRKAALDMRLVDADAEDEPTNKINATADRVHRIWLKSKPLRGTQLVFADIYATGPEGTGVPGFNVYEELRNKLIERGVPRAEIRLANEAKNDAQKVKLKADVRAGRVRVLIGSTEKMGAGMNVQDRIVALTHLDAPHRPRDIQQRNGRAHRQGNQLYEDKKIDSVDIAVVLAGGSFDGYMWQALERKAGSIDSVMKADSTTRRVDDVDEVVVDWATAKAIASGNPLVKEKADVDAQVAKLERSQKTFSDESHAVRKELAQLPAKIEGLRKKVDGQRADAETVVKHPTKADQFTIEIGGTAIDDRTVAGEMIKAAVQKAAQAGIKLHAKEQKEFPLGSFSGFKLSVEAVKWEFRPIPDVYLTLRGEENHSQDVNADASGKSFLATLEAMPARIARLWTDTSLELESSEKRETALRAKVGDGMFPKQAELETLRARQQAITSKLNEAAKPKEPPPPPPAAGPQGGPPTGGPVDLHSFLDPVSAALKMWKDANALRRARLAQSAGIRVIQAPRAKTLRDVAEMGREQRDAIYALLVPEKVGGDDTAHAARIKIALLGRKALNDERAREALLEAHAHMEKLPVADRYAFVDRYERGLPQPTPYEQKLADAIQAVMDDATDRIKALGKGHLKTFREHYWGRMLVHPKSPIGQAFKATMTRRPLQGSKSFTKQRTFEYLSDALSAGFKPITDNPVDWLLLKVREINRYAAAHEWKSEMRAEGLVKFTRPKKIPEGWSKLNDSIFTVYAKKGAQGEQRVRGWYIAPTPVARIINFYLSPGLRGNPLYDGYMFLANTMNIVSLGFSAFHAGFVAFDATVGQMAVGMQQVLTPGQRAKGVRNIAIAGASAALGPLTVLPVFSPVMQLAKGQKLRNAYRQGTTDAKLEQMVQHVASGGGRVRMDDLYRSDAITKLRLALRDKRWFGTLFEVPFAAAELSMKPILEWMVPNLKAGAFQMLAEHELSRLPTGASEDDINKVLQRAWRLTDDRLGQVVYDNYHWHNVLKHVLMGAIRAVGWNRGDVSVVLGGAASGLGAPVRAWKLVAGGGGGGGKKGGGGGGSAAAGGVAPNSGDVPEPIVDSKLAYLIALMTVTALYGAIYTYLHTGDRPGEHDGKFQGAEFLAKDLWFPRTGAVNSDHSLERLVPATYVKGAVNMIRHPVQWAEGTIQPALTLLTRLIVTNKNFIGDLIRNPHDNIAKQAAQVSAEVLKTYEPISVSSLNQRRDRGAGTREKVEGFFGNAPAPRDLVRTPAMNLMREYLGQHSDALTPEERDAANQRAQLRKEIGQAPSRDSARAELRQLVRAGDMTARQAGAIMKAQKIDPRLSMFERLKPDQAVDVYKVADEEEKALWARVYRIRQRQVDRINEKKAQFPNPFQHAPARQLVPQPTP